MEDLVEYSAGGSAWDNIVLGGNTLVRLENETQLAVSVQRPRDEAKILKASLAELDLYPSLAEGAIYIKPVGKTESGKMTYAEGLSIRTAESLSMRWGNNAYGVDIVGEDEDSATIAAVYLDYEANIRRVKQQRVSKWFKRRNGQLQKYAPDRFDVVLNANGSKILREVILRSLPAGLKKEYENKARDLLGNKVDSKRQAIVSRFKTLGVEQEKLISYVGKPVDEWKKDEMVTLLGIYNALRDGELTVKDVFEGEETPTAQELEGTVQPPKEGTLL